MARMWDRRILLRLTASLGLPPAMRMAAMRRRAAAAVAEFRQRLDGLTFRGSRLRRIARLILRRPGLATAWWMLGTARWWTRRGIFCGFGAADITTTREMRFMRSI